MNSEVYNIKDGDKITLVLASTLNLDGSPDDYYQWTSTSSSMNSDNEPTLADNYEYVMHGRVFDVEYKKDETVVLSVSFGGLLMRLTGEQKHLSTVQPDMRLYILIKKD